MRSKIFAAAMIVFTLLCVSCTDSDEDPELNILHLSYLEAPKTLDPALADDPVSLEIVSQIHETLYQFSYLKDDFAAVPLLAADQPKVSKDGLTITIPLRSDVKYHDGRELRAGDFIFALKRIALPGMSTRALDLLSRKIAGYQKFAEKLKAAAKKDFDEAFNEPIEGLSAPDRFTLKFKLTQPMPRFAQVLTQTFTAPVAPEHAPLNPETEGKPLPPPPGTGPFVLSKWTPGKNLVLNKNPHLHSEFYPVEAALRFKNRGYLVDAGKGIPFIDRIIINTIRDRKEAWSRFLAGQLDLSPVPGDLMPGLRIDQAHLPVELRSKGLQLNIEPGTTLSYLSFNMNDPLLRDNKALRQAISSAVDREAWIEKATSGRATKADSLVPVGIPDRPAKARLKYDFNRSRAQQLLKQAGFPKGEGLPILKLDMRGADALNRALGELFKQQLAAVGIQLEVIYNNFDDFLAKQRDGKMQIAYGAWSMDYPDAEDTFQKFYNPGIPSEMNDSKFHSEEANSLIQKISQMPSGPKRAELVQRFDHLIQEECPWALGYYSSVQTLLQPWISNYRGSEIIKNKLKYLRIRRELKKD